MHYLLDGDPGHDDMLTIFLAFLLKGEGAPAPVVAEAHEYVVVEKTDTAGDVAELLDPHAAAADR